MIRFDTRRILDKSTGRAMRYRAARITYSNVICKCGRHSKAITLVSSSGDIIAKQICPASWWRIAGNPMTFNNLEEWKEWYKNHPFPKEEIDA